MDRTERAYQSHRPDDIASVVRSLAGAGTGYVNGVELFVDGGLTEI